MISKNKQSQIKQRIKISKQKIKDIITKYRSFGRLKKYHAKYKKNLLLKRKNNDRYKEFHANYTKIQRLSRTIESLEKKTQIEDEEEDSTSDESSISDESNASTFHDNEISSRQGNESNEDSNVEEEQSFDKCVNCKREQHPFLIESYGVDSHYAIEFVNVSSQRLGRRKFKHNDIRINHQVPPVNYQLCRQCEQHLTLESDYNNELYCWPSFLLKVLENTSIHTKYGNYIWRFIPLQFRYWWLKHLQDAFPFVYHNVTLTTPSAIFDDITHNIKTWNEHTKNDNDTKLSDLANICNDFLLPKIMCPWGESVFLHKCGSISMDIIFQRYLLYCELVLIDNSKFSRVKWARDDYVREENDDDEWLLNPEWKIRPSIAFMNGVPRVLTCEDHDNGSNDIMIHPCRWKHSLPSDQSDQIAQVVVQSRTIRRGKASAYSTEWQMFEQRGTFGGLDTCNHVEFGKFEKCSQLRNEGENRAIFNRHDINTHLDTLCKHKIISSEMVENMRNSAQHYALHFDYEKYYKGATYVPFHSAITFQEDNRDRTISITYDNQDNNQEQHVRTKFNRYWPKVIYPCQTMSDHGVQVLIVPSFKGRSSNNKQVWQIAAMMTQVERIWQCFVKATNNTHNWYGWFLVYLTKHCVCSKNRQNKKDPFKLNQVRSIEQLKNKIPINTTTYDLFDNIDNIKCITMNEFDQYSFDNVLDNMIIDEDNEVIIIFSDGPLDEDVMNAFEFLDSVEINNHLYQLQSQIVYYTPNANDVWKGDIYTRHGGIYKNYWYQHRASKFAMKKEPNSNLEIGHEYIFVYTNTKRKCFNSMRNQYLKLLGGQSHVHCAVHKKPLIVSYKKDLKCTCGKRSKYCCAEVDCNLHICPKCFREYDTDRVTLVRSSIESDVDSDNNHDEDDESIDDNTSENSDDLISDEVIGNHVTMSEEHEFLVDDTLMMNDNRMHEDEEMVIPTDFIPTTNAGEIAIEVEEKVRYGFKFSGSNMLNNVGSLLTRSSHDFKNSRYVEHNIQKLCSVANCECIPLLYPEAMLFPSIHWKSTDDNCSIVGAIPSSLLNSYSQKEGFASVQQHIRTRLTCPSCATNSDPNYIIHCYDVLANMAASQNDTRLVINRGLTVGKDKYGSLGVRGCNDSSLLGSVDSKQMVKNLCSSQKYVSWSYFLTFTANQSRHFGLKPIRSWLKRKGWQQTYNGYHDMNETDQTEVDSAVNQAASGLMLRIWEEVSKLFLDFLTGNPNSPYKNVKATFSRREYQSNSGNLGHAHIILAINWDRLTDEECEFVKNLARGSIFDVVRSDEIQDYIDRELIKSQDDVSPLVEDVDTFLTHKCNDRCLVKRSDGGFRCRMPKYIFMTPDNTKQNFVDMPAHITDECWLRLNKIGLANELHNIHGDRNEFKSTLGYFHPKRWVPAIVPGDAPLSPYESETFCICQSMQNCQRLDQAGGCCKYTCKYLVQVDKQNYVTISMNKDKKGSLETNSTYLHNTKIASSDLQQEKEKDEKRGVKHPEGRCVALTEMLHVMLQYPEVYTDLAFVSISTLPLELRCYKKITTDTQVEDGVYTTSVSYHVRSEKDNFPRWRRHNQSELIIMNDLKQSGMGYDKITQFSLRPPELKVLIDMVGHYYRWFYIDMGNKVSSVDMVEALKDNIFDSIWIDGLQRQVKLRQKAIVEITEWCNFVENEDANDNENNDGKYIMISLIRKIQHVLVNDVTNLEEDEVEFLAHVKDNLIYDDHTQHHLPIPVYSYVRPSNPVQFINHILLSMGRFSTEIDLMMHESIRDCFQYAKLIGEERDEEQLQSYSNQILAKFIKEQIRYFPNSMRVINSFIVTAGIVFDHAIVHGEIAVTDMPPVQFSLLSQSMQEEMVQNRKCITGKIIDAVFLELDHLVESCNIPCKEELMNATLQNRLDWDPVECFVQGNEQSDGSYIEQKLAISTCKNTIDSYVNIMDQTTMTKSVTVRGHPGAGKTFCMLYTIVYAISQGLMVLSTAKMSHRSLQLGGINWDKILCLRGNDGNVNPHRRAELAISRIRKDRKKEDLLMSLHVIFADELGQISAEDISMYDIILRHIRGSNMFMGGVLLIGTLDHLQIQPINGRPFLTANAIIPCFKMIALKHSVRATGSEYIELQSLVRKDYLEFDNNPNLMLRFRGICSRIFTFVDDWTDERITSQTFRVFSKRFPAKAALDDFQFQLKQKYRENPTQLRYRKAEDCQKSRYSHDWRPAELDTSQLLDKKTREPQLLLFEVGLIYTCTFNDKRKSNSQKAILYDLPSQQTLDSFGSIKVLLAPPGCKEVMYENGRTKESYLEMGYIETSIECAPYKICTLPNNLQGVRKQYGLQHYVAGTIHSAMGDTLPSIATTFSLIDRNYSVWDKGQLLVIISRTKLARDTIFVGDKESTLDALSSILKSRTQWTDHMENILRVVTTNFDEEQHHQQVVSRATMTQASFPFRMNDIFLPNDCSGYVYMLISLRSNDFCYIGKTKDLHQRMRSHQSGHGSLSSQPEHLRPYAYFAYICGFNGNETMIYYVENQWKQSLNNIRNQGIQDPKVWAQRGGNDVLNLNLSNFGIDDTRSELRLVLLFK
jgi:predicted GIY-YIG superfamily endonuclease